MKNLKSKTALLPLKSILKKAAVIALLSTSAASVLSAPSYAIVSVFTGGAALLATGAILTVSGTAMFIGGAAGAGPIVAYPGILAGIAGIVLLDDHNQVSPRFTALDTGSADQLGISSDEREAYNNQIDEINAVYQTIAQETRQASQSGVSQSDLVKLVSQHWQEYGQSLSPAARVALTRVQASLGSQMTAKQ